MRGRHLTSEALTAALARVAAGDSASLEAVYHATSDKLMGVCLRILRDHGEAESVLQDVYVTVWRRAGAFSPERGEAISWLCAVARNRAIDRARAARGPLTGSVALDEVEIADASRSAIDLLVLADEHALLHRSLDNLQEPCRSVIRTAFFEGVTYDALARRMGVPQGTMKSWVRRGLGQLRHQLEPSSESADARF